MLTDGQTDWQTHRKDKNYIPPLHTSYAGGINISVYAIFNDQSFNDTLTNDIVSFEQLGLGFFTSLSTLFKVYHMLLVMPIARMCSAKTYLLHSSLFEHVINTPYLMSFFHLIPVVLETSHGRIYREYSNKFYHVVHLETVYLIINLKQLRGIVTSPSEVPYLPWPP